MLKDQGAYIHPQPSGSGLNVTFTGKESDPKNEEKNLFAW
jgi:hypothetical protein